MRLLSATVFFTAVMSLATTVVAQAQSTPPSDQAGPAKDEAAPALTLAQAEAALAAIEADTGMEESVKELLRAKYKQAIESLKESASLASRAEQYRESLTGAPETATQLRARLEELPSVESAGDVGAPADHDELQQALDAQRAELAALNERMSNVTSDTSLAEQRPAEISERIPEAERELAEVRKQLAQPEEATSPGRVADRFVLRAREAKLLNELEMLKQEQLSQSVRRGLQQAQRDLYTRQIENASAALAAYEALMNESVTKQARDIAARAEHLQGELPKDNRRAAALAAEVQDLARQLEGVLRDRRGISSAKADMTIRLRRLSERYDSIKKQLELDQSGVEMAQLLIDLRALLYTRSREVSRARQWPTLAQARLAAVQVDFKIDGQKELADRLAGESSAEVRELLAIRAEVLDMLQLQYLDLIPIQASLDSETRLYLDKAEEIRAGITRELFWIRSSPPLDFGSLRETPSGLLWALGPEHWSECRRALTRGVSRAPASSAIVLLLAIVLLVTRPRIGAALRRAGSGVGRVSTDRFGLTGKAALWTVLLALPIPLLFAFAAWAFAWADAPSLWMRDVNRAMSSALLIISSGALIAACCHPGGLGGTHFGWRKESLDWLRRGSRWFVFVYVPLALLAYCTLSSQSGRHLHSFGRACLLCAFAWLLVFLVRLVFFSGVFRRTPDSEGAPRPFPRSPVLRAVPLIGCPIGFMTLVGLGYTLTAFNLSFAFVLTLIIIVTGVILHAIALRWFRIKQRKLAFAEALERRRARREATAGEEQGESEEVVLVDADEQELDLDSVGEQTRSVLRLCFGLAMATAVFYFWSTTLPLIPYLDTIRVPMTVDFTLLELAMAVLIVAVTWLVAKNLPGMLELAVLRATSMGSGTRHAIATICQYAVVATGLVLLFNVLDLDWAKFGWIAGGLSVGIGFGMQEVVANFVCGLILLLERPIRVGDVVTVEGMTGTVTKLQMRATTITNWDRQDFVVPNKTLITGTILNWTLSAPLTRVVIPVGVAYGTDTDKARQILLDAATDHPLILEDPPPLATFEQFADSSLNLVLRAYLPDLDNRLGTITELHTEIGKRFSTAGIEIAFPQRDIHVRNGSSGAHAETVESSRVMQERTGSEAERSVVQWRTGGEREGS